MDEKYLLEKVYDKYQMEISRKDRIEGKSIGYYTIIGIFFAAFLVIEPLLFEKGLLIKFSVKEFLSIINFAIIILFIATFVFSVFKLHGNYKPKKRPEFDPIRNWEVLSSLDESAGIESVRIQLSENIQYLEEQNNKMSKVLESINTYCVVMILSIICVFGLLILTYFL